MGEAWEAQGQIQACGTTPLRLSEERGRKGGARERNINETHPHMLWLYAAASSCTPIVV
jgi:hypothetical protein